MWLIGGLLSFLGALTYAELGAMNPDAGGLYSYIRDAFGPLPAFLYGWTSIARHRERLDRRACRGLLELPRPALPDRPGRRADRLRGRDRGDRAHQHSRHARKCFRRELGDGHEGRRAAGAEHRADRARSWIRRYVARRRLCRPTSAARPALGARDDRRALGIRGLAVRHVLGRRDARSAARLSARRSRSRRRR